MGGGTQRAWLTSTAFDKGDDKRGDGGGSGGERRLGGLWQKRGEWKPFVRSGGKEGRKRGGQRREL